ncbi:MAG: hypothetical protein MI867_08545 [Pseudomonadales bacterium]|nr:hypothetical protein [Pseudomonadales bacterium]
MKIQKKFRKYFPKKRITIATLSNRFKGSVCSWLAKCWEEDGYKVEVITDLEKAPKTDLLILHLNLTHIPDHILDSARKICPVIVNGAANSINKTLFSQQALSIDSDHAGKVIVKTKANYGGIPELIHDQKVFDDFNLDKHIESIHGAINENKETAEKFWLTTSTLDPNDYPKFTSIDAVPNGVWKNPKLMVEKYLPEINSDGKHVLRHWYFFGDRDFSRTLIAQHSSPKWGSMTDEERVISRKEWWQIKVNLKPSVPEEVQAVREALNLDYGRIDWALHEGVPVVFDANKTPFIGNWSLKNELDQQRHAIMQGLAKGIEDFL